MEKKSQVSTTFLKSQATSNFLKISIKNNPESKSLEGFLSINGKSIRSIHYKTGLGSYLIIKIIKVIKKDSNFLDNSKNPILAIMLKKVQIFTNYFRVEMNRDIFKYDIVMSDGDPVKNKEVVTSVLFKCKENRELIRTSFGNNYLFLNNSFYTLQMVSDPIIITSPDGLILTIQHDSNQCLRDETKNNIKGRLIKILQKKLRLKFVGKKMFSPKEAVSVRSFEIWPGYATAFNVFTGLSRPLTVLNVDLMHKIITNQNILELLQSIKEWNQRDFEQVIQNELIANSVMTCYNWKIYRVDWIDFNKSPLDTFTMQDGSNVRFMDYYEQKYKVKITCE